MKPTEMHISICGHAKHGKSTLAGRLLYELGTVSKSELTRLRKEAEERNRETKARDFNEFSLMFLKQRSVTFSKGGSKDDPSRTDFPEYGRVTLKDNRLVTLIDTPGLPRFISNIIYGIYLSDLAILVVEAAAGVQEGTQDVARILASLDIPIIAVFVTKIDVVGYSELRFRDIEEEIKEKIFPIINSYSDLEVPPIVPISALTGVGFRPANQQMAWYTGINALQAFERAQRNASPDIVTGVRFVIEGSREVFSPPGIGTVLVGVLETGTLRVGSQLLIEPQSRIEDKRIILRTRSLHRARSVMEKQAESASEISAREIVAIATSDLSVLKAADYFGHGGVLGTLDSPPSVASEINAEVIFFELNTVYSGREYVIHTNASNGVARITEIRKRNRDRFNYYNLESDKYTVNAGEFVLARLRFKRPLCIESSPEYQRLTRFVLRERDRIVACGRCLNIL